MTRLIVISIMGLSLLRRQKVQKLIKIPSRHINTRQSWWLAKNPNANLSRGNDGLDFYSLEKKR